MPSLQLALNYGIAYRPILELPQPYRPLSLLLKLISFPWRLIYLDSLFDDFTFVCYTHLTTGVCL